MEVNYFTILYWFCHTSTCIHHRYTRVPHPELPSILPPRTIPLGRPSAPVLSIQYHALNLGWQLISYMILDMFQCHSPKSSHPRPLPQSPKDCSIYLCLFCCLTRDTFTPMFIAALFIIARTWKQPRCPSADEWVRKLWYIYTMEYYSAIKKNTFESVLMRWMKLEPIIESEVSQKEKHQYSILTHIYGI